MGEENAYEAERARRIAQNKARMAQLGLAEASAALGVAVEPLPAAAAAGGARPKPRRAPAKKKPAPPAGPVRESKRLRGAPAPAPAVAAETALREAAAAAEPGPLGITSKGNPRKALELPEHTVFAAPFTLRSIATTVWELGAVHRGAWAQRYWSSRGCLFHHAYPVGYRATKEAFGRTFEMRIDPGEAGPLFTVRDIASGRVFTGASPTKPWTEVCLAQRTGQRISGPLFFGFSDPLTQQAIAAALYSPRELAAALAGEVVEPDVLTPEEAAAKEFQGLEGVGEKTAAVLARTAALGGARQGGVASLRAWVRAAPAHGPEMLTFLLESEEVPAVTRRWPAWRERLAPRLVAALLREEGKEVEVEAAEKVADVEEEAEVGGADEQAKEEEEEAPAPVPTEPEGEQGEQGEEGKEEKENAAAPPLAVVQLQTAKENAPSGGAMKAGPPRDGSLLRWLQPR